MKQISGVLMGVFLNILNIRIAGPCSHSRSMLVYTKKVPGGDVLPAMEQFNLASQLNPPLRCNPSTCLRLTQIEIKVAILNFLPATGFILQINYTINTYLLQKCKSSDLFPFYWPRSETPPAVKSLPFYFKNGAVKEIYLQ